MSEQDVFKRLSPTHGKGLRKPPMRLSPQRNSTVIRHDTHRIPTKRIESPKYISKLVNAKNINMAYTSPLRPGTPTVVDTLGSGAQNNSYGSPNRVKRRANNVIDDSPIKGKNILTKLKQEINMIDKLGTSPSNTLVKKEDVFDNAPVLKKNVRFDIPSASTLNINGSGETTNLIKLVEEILLQQKEQNEKLDKILERQDELETKIDKIKQEKN